MAVSLEKSEVKLKELCYSQEKRDTAEVRLKLSEGGVQRAGLRQCVSCGQDVLSPQLLPCLHSACQDCIPGLSDNDSTLSCPSPTCSPAQRPVTMQEIVPNGPLERYVKGHHLLSLSHSGTKPYCGNRRHQANEERVEAMAYCPTCEKHFCVDCHSSHEMFREDAFKDHHMRTLGQSGTGDNKDDDIAGAFLVSPSPSPCPSHQGKLIEFFCTTCDAVLCQACVWEDHLNHKTEPLSSYTFPPGRNVVSVSRRALLDWEVKCLGLLANLEIRHSRVELAEQAAQNETEELFMRLADQLEQRKVKLLQEIAIAAARPKSRVKSAIQKLQDCFATVQRSGKVLQFFEEHSSMAELLQLRNVVCLQADLVHSSCMEASVVPAQSDVVKVLFEREEDSFCRMVSSLGAIDRGLDPSQCTVKPAPSGVMHKVVSSGSLEFCVICPGASEGSFCEGNVTSFFRSPSALSPPIRGSAVNSDDRLSCLVTFQWFYTGQCEMDVLLNGRHISGSPFVFTLAVLPDLNSSKLLERVLSIPPFTGTIAKDDQGGFSRLAVSTKGTVYVSDNIRHTIHKLDPQLNYLGVVEACRGVIDRPRAIALNAADHLFVVHSHVVSVFDSRGPTRTIGEGLLYHPWDIAIGPTSGKVFVSDTWHHRIVVFDADGINVLRTFGSEGSGVGQFAMPSGLAFFSNGNLVVSDTQNNRLQVFTPEGSPLYVISTIDLVHPRQILTTIEGFVYCASSGSHCVLVFDGKGKKVASLGEYGCKLGQFMGPKGIAMSLDGHLLVSEGQGYRVQVFWQPS